MEVIRRALTGIAFVAALVPSLVWGQLVAPVTIGTYHAPQFGIPGGSALLLTGTFGPSTVDRSLFPNGLITGQLLGLDLVAPIGSGALHASFAGTMLIPNFVTDVTGQHSSVVIGFDSSPNIVRRGAGIDYVYSRYIENVYTGLGTVDEGALWIGAGKSRFDGPVVVNDALTVRDSLTLGPGPNPTILLATVNSAPRTFSFPAGSGKICATDTSGNLNLDGPLRVGMAGALPASIATSGTVTVGTTNTLVSSLAFSATAGIFLARGDDGLGNAFADLVFVTPSAATNLTSMAVTGMPPSRIYTVTNGAVYVRMGGGIYQVTMAALAL